jgi:polysaccharide pyruvyl transferase WcaK-like protein
MKRILYIGWLGHNNLGDELMWEIFNSLCSSYFNGDYQVSRSTSEISLKDTAYYDILVLGGGSILLPRQIDWLHHAIKMNKKIMIWGSGYDWAEKKFVDLLEKSSISACLYNDKTKTQLIEVVDKSLYTGVRGPLTYSLLKSANVNMEKVHLSGDPGLLLKPAKFPNRCPITKFNSKDKIIALNWGTSFNRIFGNNEEYAENQLAEVCKKLLAQNYKIYMYTVWPEDIESSERLHRKIGFNNNVIFDTNLYSAGELLRILQQCTLSINLKLHANIISVTAGVPFVCLGYRFKCFDFIKSMDLKELIVPTDDKLMTQNIHSAIAFINSNRSLISGKLEKYKELYSKRLLRPFKEGLL